MDNMDFQNNQINTEDIPSSGQIIFEKLEPSYRKVSIYMTAFFFVIVLIVYLGIGIMVEELLRFPIILIAMILWSIITGISIIIAIKSYDYQGFALREKDILYQSGIFLRSKVIIPFNRIQHCEVEQGPIDRMFNLSEISLFTAGGSGSDLSIPGLTHEKANALKKFITNRLATDEEE
jgi:membrane protein YdbS with pleckstrin-like domain